MIIEVCQQSSGRICSPESNQMLPGVIIGSWWVQCILHLHCFSYQSVNQWNSLTHEEMDAPSVNSLKNRLAKRWRRKMDFFMDWYGPQVLWHYVSVILDLCQQWGQKLWMTSLTLEFFDQTQKNPWLYTLYTLCTICECTVCKMHCTIWLGLGSGLGQNLQIVHAWFWNCVVHSANCADWQLVCNIATLMWY